MLIPVTITKRDAIGRKACIQKAVPQAPEAGAQDRVLECTKLPPPVFFFLDFEPLTQKP
jgi:hypothetical protein